VGASSLELEAGTKLDDILKIFLLHNKSAFLNKTLFWDGDLLSTLLNFLEKDLAFVQLVRLIFKHRNLLLCGGGQLTA